MKKKKKRKKLKIGDYVRYTKKGKIKKCNKEDVRRIGIVFDFELINNKGSQKYYMSIQ